MDVSNRIHAGRVSASLCCFPLAGGFLLCFAGFRPLLIDYPGGDFLLASLIASFFFEFALNVFIFTFSLRAGTAWHKFFERLTQRRSPAQIFLDEIDSGRTWRYTEGLPLNISDMMKSTKKITNST